MSCDVAGCGRPVDDATFCAPCRNALERELGEVPALVAELSATMARETRRAANTRPGGAETALIVNLAASRALDTLTGALTRAGRVTAQQTGPKPWLRVTEKHGHRPAAVAGWLMGHIEALRHADGAARAVDDIKAACHAGWKLVDGPENRTTFPVGPCPEATEIGPCVGEVRAYVPRDEGTLARLRCTVCGAIWWPWQWNRAGRRILHRQQQLDPAATRRLLAQLGPDLTHCA